jgi:hypothetical protein
MKAYGGAKPPLKYHIKFRALDIYMEAYVILWIFVITTGRKGKHLNTFE